MQKQKQGRSNVFDELYHEGTKSKERMNQMRREIQEYQIHEEVKNCTFKPQINPKTEDDFNNSAKRSRNRSPD